MCWHTSSWLLMAADIQWLSGISRVDNVLTKPGTHLGSCWGGPSGTSSHKVLPPPLWRCWPAQSTSLSVSEACHEKARARLNSAEHKPRPTIKPRPLDADFFVVSWISRTWKVRLIHETNFLAWRSALWLDYNLTLLDTSILSMDIKDLLISPFKDKKVKV